ncbi:EAL domain, c-di-GMP-specific phosphodiesterase class I (or its enzymatically inactive variant) [Pseudobutyrivibrio sp. OR37]|uniref:EAL domain-containing protein n=1 Tax=Pseudobutyrivibrio sp. OR37 TaxID=1798186 RepID=UPI0008EDE66C|nr:GGDEF domain-containing phosphodiesterase [Pseudobutyrivibrio sp. OR37]SFH53387.1 EAL domain, c-di-GMP-specific phosphodiesterase class I (or its enzymatically inactive variant) [Pseudobutyrivibrio sp. OR37]
MWDYSFAIPSILILGILLLNYFALQRLPIKKNKTFVGLLLIETVVISSDIIGSWACENYFDLPISTVYVSNMIFFVFFLLRGFFFFVLTCNILELNPIENLVKTVTCNIPLVFSILVVLSTPWTKAIFLVNEDGYARGYAYHLITFTFLYYILFSIIMVFSLRKYYKRLRELYGTILYLTILLIGLAFRIFLPKYLLMDTFCIMAILTINIIFMNPDFYIDRQTRLFNRDGIRLYLDEKYSKKHSIFAFVIDHYAETTEIYGHKQMDAGLLLIGNYLRWKFGNTLIFYCRSGRFVFVVNNNSEVDTIIDTLMERFKRPWISDDVELYLNISFAKIKCDYQGYTSDSILNVIVNALEIASSNNEKTIIDIDDRAFIENHETILIKRALERATEDHSVAIFLQPIVDAKTHGLVGAESLCRIFNSSGELIPPDKFIPIAENNGRIYQLGEQVFEKTCAFIRDNDLESFGLKWINVNLSTAQFMKKDLAESFERLINEYHISHEKIHLEITEASITDELIMKDQIEKLKQKGFELSLDDYGTGYSNASRLKHFPFHNVKIDMSLIWDYCNEPDIILPTLVETFKRSGYTITAEGIETEEMANAMTQIGCNYLQGMHFSLPLPVDEFIARYKK